VDASLRGLLLGAESASALEIALDSFFTHLSITTSLCRSGFDGSPSSRKDWNLTLSVLQIGANQYVDKNDRYSVSSSTCK